MVQCFVRWHTDNVKGPLNDFLAVARENLFSYNLIIVGYFRVISRVLTFSCQWWCHLATDNWHNNWHNTQARLVTTLFPWRKKISEFLLSITLYLLRWITVFPKSVNKYTLPVLNIPFDNHWSAYLRTDIRSYEGSSHLERNCFKSLCVQV